MSDPPEPRPFADPSSPAQVGAPVQGVDGRLRELEHVVVRSEGQVKGLLQRVEDIEAALRLARKRALVFRLALLVLMLSAYVVIRARYSG